jgi:hypothetical protein
MCSTCKVSSFFLFFFSHFNPFFLCFLCIHKNFSFPTNEFSVSSIPVQNIAKFVIVVWWGEFFVSQRCHCLLYSKDVNSVSCCCRFDHHCPYTNSCIGANNHRFYFAFLCTIFIDMVTFLWFMANGISVKMSLQ